MTLAEIEVANKIYQELKHLLPKSSGHRLCKQLAPMVIEAYLKAELQCDRKMTARQMHISMTLADTGLSPARLQEVWRAAWDAAPNPGADG